eukprot:132104-Rhodomonas_salina.1
MASPSTLWTLMPLRRWQTSMTTRWQYHLAWLDQLGVRTLRELREVLVPPTHPFFSPHRTHTRCQHSSRR